jgi:hypothetical protein
MPAASWLQQAYDWDDSWVMKFSEERYEEQQLWWDQNGKHFKLLDLPRELREAVYLQIIGPVILPDEYRLRVVLGQGLSYGNSKRPGRNCDPDIESPNMAIMRINKQIREEANLVAHRDTIKRLREVALTQAYDRIRQPRHGI